MKKTFLIGLLIACAIITMTGQVPSVSFSYDSNGCRTIRTLLAQKSSIVEFPVGEFVLASSDESKEESTEDVFINVYPNPTNSILHVRITDPETSNNAICYLYGLDGNILITKSISTNLLELNISHIPNGVYVLRVIIKDIILDWKIIKAGF